MIYDSAAIYIESCTTVRAKITAIDAVIAALMSTALKAASNEDISEYWLNDGQTQIKTVYKSTEAVYNSINAFKKLKQEYINSLTGRVIRLVDSKNFTGRHGR